MIRIDYPRQAIRTRRDNSDDVLVDAFIVVEGLLAIHKLFTYDDLLIEAGQWTLTHIPTGRTIINHTSKLRVIMIAEVFMQVAKMGIIYSDDLEVVVGGLPEAFMQWVKHFEDNTNPISYEEFKNKTLNNHTTTIKPPPYESSQTRTPS